MAEAAEKHDNRTLHQGVKTLKGCTARPAPMVKLEDDTFAVTPLENRERWQRWTCSKQDGVVVSLEAIDVSRREQYADAAARRRLIPLQASNLPN